MVEDASALIRAEIALAKTELTRAVKAKATGGGLLVGAGVCGWLALQGLLLAAGFALALVLPGWAAALVVSVLLLMAAGVLALVGRRLLATPVSIETTKHNVEEDLAWTKAHLSGR
ncbi:MAG TPA: phage holin family protein [Egibacteraceae bacterium]|nr:phage holin family protein [Egibacteraceae bacterium]